MLVTQWATVNQEQFGKILDLFAAQPDLMQNIRGSGDVPYLSGEDADQVAVSVKESAIALLTAFEALRGVNAELTALSRGITEALDVVLPDDMAATFAEKVIRPFQEGMITALTSGGKTEDVEKKLTAMQAKLQAQTAAWAGFGEAMMKGLDIEEALAGVRDLGAKFRAAIQPQYDAIQASLEQGNTRLAATQTANAERLMTLWAAFGEQMSKGLALEEGLAGIGDLGAKFTSVIEPQYAAIEAALVEGNTRVALTLGKAVDRQLALWAAFGASMEQGINVDESLAGVADLGAKFRAKMAPQFAAIEAALIAGDTTLARDPRENDRQTARRVGRLRPGGGAGHGCRDAPAPARGTRRRFSHDDATGVRRHPRRAARGEYHARGVAHEGFPDEAGGVCPDRPDGPRRAGCPRRIGEGCARGGGGVTNDSTAHGGHDGSGGRRTDGRVREGRYRSDCEALRGVPRGRH